MQVLPFLASADAVDRTDGNLICLHKLEWFGPNWLREQIPPQIMGEHVFQIMWEHERELASINGKLTGLSGELAGIIGN